MCRKQNLLYTNGTAMARNFELDDGGDKDTGLTVLLLIVTITLSVFTVQFFLPGITISIGPIAAFLVTRFACKRHFRKLIAEPMSSD